MTHFMYGLIRVQNEIERQIACEGQYFSEQSKNALSRLQDIDKKKAELIRQYSEEEKTKAVWGVWQNALQYFASSVSIISGTALSGPAPVAGWLLIAAGCTGLLNRAMADTGGWQAVASLFAESHRERIELAQTFDSCTFYLTTAISLASATSAYFNGAIVITEVSRKTLQSALFASSIMQMATRLGVAHADKKMQDVKATQKEKEATAFVIRQEIMIDHAHMRIGIECSEVIERIVQQSI
jgi:hypothetical protein